MKNIDFDKLNTKIADFLTRHKSSLYKIVSNNSNLFETFCFVIFVRYYEEAGYELKPKNLLDGKFRFKYNTRGYPWNYSYFVAVTPSKATVEEEEILFEIRHNQQVSAAWLKLNGEDGNHDPPMFALDVAIIKPSSLPDLVKGQKRKDENYWVDNKNLITFGEAKKLTAYPMLLAQFYGIVHEVKPEFLQPYKKEPLQILLEQHHPPPVLLTSNHLTWGTKRILQSFGDRDLLIRVVEDVTGSPEAILLQKMKGKEAGN
jgi:hypothetical protein